MEGREVQPSSSLEKLRDEILHSEQTRMDLVKWKLVLAGAIGATGLGLAGAEDSPGQADLVLCAVPLVCVYVDLACWHLSLRILVIGSFIRTHAVDDLGRYEQHARMNRAAFGLEDLALRWSTIVLSLAVFGYGMVVGFSENWSQAPPFLVSAATGLLGTVFGHFCYDKRSDDVDEGKTPHRCIDDLRDLRVRIQIRK
jgi:hypothetical protein